MVGCEKYRNWCLEWSKLYYIWSSRRSCVCYSSDLRALTHEVQRLNEEVQYLRNKDKETKEIPEMKMIEYKTDP